MTERPIRVIVVSDDPLARSGLSSLLAPRPDIEVVGESGTADAAAAWSARPDADAVAWDGQAASPWARDRLRDLAESGARVLALVADETEADEALGAGALGLMFRDARSDELEAALRAVSQRLAVLEGTLARRLLRPRPPARPPSRWEALTAREREVLELLAQGLSNRAIARELGVSEHTAKFHVNSILGKLGARTRAEAVAKAARQGWLLI